jgi:hypothetical protein
MLSGMLVTWFFVYCYEAMYIGCYKYYIGVVCSGGENSKV